MATAGVQSGSNVQDLVVARNVAPPGGGPKNHPAMDNDDASTIDQDISSLADDNDVGEVQIKEPCLYFGDCAPRIFSPIINHQSDSNRLHASTSSH